MGNNITHIDKCKDYLDGLSDDDRQLVKKYTLDYYNTLTSYLVSRVNMCMLNPYDSTTVDFATSTTDKSIQLYKILVNAPKIEHNIKLYHFFSHVGKYNRFIKVNMLNSAIPLSLSYKHTLERGDKYIEPKFISTTYDSEVLKFLSGFSNYNENCCYIEFIIPAGFPLLTIPPDYSYYPYQKEVILPYGLLFEVLERKHTTLKLYNPKDIIETKDNNDIRNVFVSDDKKLYDKAMSAQEMRLDVKIINKENIDFMNKMLYELYYKYSPNAHDYNHIVRVMMVSLILLKMYEEITKQKYSNLIHATMYTGLFHDSGRKGRDGKDYWEKDSADIARDKLKDVNVPEETISTITKAIYNPDDTNLLHMIFKGSDSIDIIRVKQYKKKYNPFFKFIEQEEKNVSSRISDILDKLENEQMLLIKVMSFIQQSYKNKQPIESYFEDEELDLCGREFEEEGENDGKITNSFEEYVDDVLEDDSRMDDKTITSNLLKTLEGGKISSQQRLEKGIRSKTRTTMSANKQYIIDVVRYIVDKKFFSDERKEYIMSDAIILYSLLSDVLPIYKQYLSGFVFQV